MSQVPTDETVRDEQKKNIGIQFLSKHMIFSLWNNSVIFYCISKYLIYTDTKQIQKQMLSFERDKPEKVKLIF